jgi:hypothetical protein
LRGIVAAYRPCEATDPRDKIYAGLGLLGGRRQEDVLAFKPNYDVTAQVLYTEFARYWILRGKFHFVLNRCGGPCHVQGLPSLAPDLTPSKIIPGIDIPDMGLKDEHERRASGDLLPFCELSLGGDKLLL